MEMARILITEDGKRIDISQDNLCLYSAPENPPDTGTTYIKGINLYAHKTRKGNWYYFFERWSMWAGVEGVAALISKKKAIRFLQEWAELSESDIQEINEHFGEDIFSEDA